MPSNKQKHFLVTKLITQTDFNAAIEWIEIEAVHSKRAQILPLHTLLDATHLLQGW